MLNELERNRLLTVRDSIGDALVEVQGVSGLLEIAYAANGVSLEGDQISVLIELLDSAAAKLREASDAADSLDIGLADVMADGDNDEEKED